MLIVAAELILQKIRSPTCIKCSVARGRYGMSFLLRRLSIIEIGKSVRELSFKS